MAPHAPPPNVETAPTWARCLALLPLLPALSGCLNRGEELLGILELPEGAPRPRSLR